MWIILQFYVICVGIRAVTATIYVAINVSKNTHGITAIDVTCYIVTSIDVVDVTRQHPDT